MVSRIFRGGCFSRAAAHGLLAAALIVATAGRGVAAGNAPEIRIEQAWARATPNGATVAVGYLTIRNDGGQPDRLTGIRSTAAGQISPHTMSMTDGVMRMRALPGLVIPPHGAVTLKPGADHLMLEQLARPLKQGDRIPMTLTFEHAGAIAVTFSVEAIGAQGPPARPEP